MKTLILYLIFTNFCFLICKAQVEVHPKTSSIYSGDIDTLKAYGAKTYTWSPAWGLSATTGSSVIANPTITITYTIIGDGKANNKANVTINILPPINMSMINFKEGSKKYICYPVEATRTFNDLSLSFKVLYINDTDIAFQINAGSVEFLKDVKCEIEPIFISSDTNGAVLSSDNNIISSDMMNETAFVINSIKHDPFNLREKYQIDIPGKFQYIFRSNVFRNGKFQFNLFPKNTSRTLLVAFLKFSDYRLMVGPILIIDSTKKAKERKSNSVTNTQSISKLYQFYCRSLDLKNFDNVILNKSHEDSLRFIKEVKFYLIHNGIIPSDTLIKITYKLNPFLDTIKTFNEKRIIFPYKIYIPKTICPNDFKIISDSILLILNNCFDLYDDAGDSLILVLSLINSESFSENKRQEHPHIYPAPPIASRILNDSIHLINPASIYTKEAIDFYTGIDYNNKTMHDLDYYKLYFTPYKAPMQRDSLIISNLNRIKNIGIYQKFNYDFNDDGNSLNGNQFACYVQCYDLEDYNTLIGTSIGFNGCGLGLNIENEKMKKIWVECYIPVNDSMIPSGIPDMHVKPIALETDKNIYFFAQKKERPLTAGSYGLKLYYQCEIFDLSQAKNLTSTYDKVIEIFNEEINKQFTTTPLSCMPIQTDVPEQLKFQRQFLKSNVLDGFAGPYYELSTYILSLYNLPYTVRNDKIYLQAEHCFQLAVGKMGDYVEPTEEQYSAYEKAVNTAIINAIRNTTNRLNGVFSVNKGIIK